MSSRVSHTAAFWWLGLAAGVGVLGALMFTVTLRNVQSLIPPAAAVDAAAPPGAQVVPTPGPNATPGPGTAPYLPGLSDRSVTALLGPTTVSIDAVLGRGAVAGGSGIVLTSSGIVLTDAHVVRGVKGITAQVGGRGRTYRAALIGTDPAADVALLQLEHASGLRSATLGSLATVREGDDILALGYPDHPGGPDLARGGVTDLHAPVTTSDEHGDTAGNYLGLLETDAPTKPGYSGGPAVDAWGRVVAVNECGDTTDSGAPAGYSCAIPIDVALQAAREIAKSGHGTVFA